MARRRTRSAAEFCWPPATRVENAFAVAVDHRRLCRAGAADVGRRCRIDCASECTSCRTPRVAIATAAAYTHCDRGARTLGDRRQHC